MEVKKRIKKRAFVDEALCVACGSCVKVCPVGAISVPKGITAVVNADICIGCGKCSRECPASIITISEV